MKQIGILCLISIFTIFNDVQAQVSVGEKGTLSGRVYSDYYWFAQHHDSEVEGNNGFWFRRIYLTYERSISDHFSSRLRLEMNSSGDLSTNTEMTPTVKDAYLKWSKNSHQIYAGISSTPTFGLVEDVWGYRSVEKAPQDLFDFGSSRDFGLAAKGEFGQDNRIGYHFFVGNGSSNGVELNKGKKLMLSLSYQLTEHFVIQAYGDWNEQPNNVDIVTGQGFAGYQSDNFNIGALYSYQFQDNIHQENKRKQDLISVFANANFTDKVGGFIRADHLFDPNPGGASTSYLPMSSEAGSSTFVVGGVDLLLHDNIHLMPNVEAVFYGETQTGTNPEANIVPRLTLSYNF
ncbi:porin [Fodinibius salsisoli]|uniref:Porin n=1 Tax=Fodinibius salsisoli TaxID=2820877 RepID=A0ABT3PQI0_9BACT|nr:porin [Fodinibius salsisoli]MCW9708113.1 hypothetical protein [Fodinibius salsisoli]